MSQAITIKRIARDIVLIPLVVTSAFLAFAATRAAADGNTELGAIAVMGALVVAGLVFNLSRKVKILAPGLEEFSDPYLLAAVMDSASEGIFITGPDAVIQRVNPAFTAITGYRPEDAIGMTPSILRSHHHDPEFYRNMRRTLETTGRWQGEIWNRRKDDGVYLEWLSISAIRPVPGETTQYIAVFSDISDEHVSPQSLYNHDALTGLPNRTLLLDRLGHAIRVAERDGSRLAVMLLDIDRFKLINDGLGHNIGDSFLRMVAERLPGLLREGDTVARFGGDEFVLLLPDIDRPGSISSVAEKVLAAFHAPFELGGSEIHVTASLGISMFPGDGTVAQTLIKGAEAAMYAVKDRGRNGYRFFAAGMNDAAAERLAMETGLHHALEHDQLVVHYQPKISLADGRMIGTEALVRWKSPLLGMIPPDRFIPVAEETGLIVRIGERVLALVCRQIADWRVAGHDFGPVAVNVSARQLSAPDFVDRLMMIMARAGIEPSAIELELTETAVMSEPDMAVAILRRLAGIGVKLHLDDFGTGQSGLAYLRQLPVSTLKIDGSFVRDMSVQETSVELVRGIIQLADAFGMAVVAECVETEEQAERLRSMGCAVAQGYLYSPPLPAEDLAARWCRPPLTIRNDGAATGPL